jgi:coenzyme F420-reducing hydrogenase alpha subunit
MSTTTSLKVDYLTRVEGEGRLSIKIKDEAVEEVKLRIFEPPRFFEAFLRGRSYREVPDITARICGICPVAYQMSAVQALETAFGVSEVGEAIRLLRRLIYCGEWIESHALHIYMLHAPDFLGYADAIQMAKVYPAEVQRGLKLKKIGNELIRLVGGREIHPINVRVGGFYRTPDPREFAALKEELKWAQEAALQTVYWTAKLPFPKFEQDYEFVALHHPDEYAINEGRLISNKGLDISVSEYEEHFEEVQVSYSNALQAVIKERGDYLVGPLARYNLNFEQLSPSVRAVAQEIGLSRECRNPFQSIIVRSLELLYICEEALALIEKYQMPERPALELTPGASTGHGCTEAPRGILYHRYEIDKEGLIQQAKIVPPTSQNQKRIEHDLREFVLQRLELNTEELTWQCEQAIRNYDPCISCATHFLKLDLIRE